MPKDLRMNAPKIMTQKCLDSGVRWIEPGNAQSGVLGYLT